MLSSLGGFTRDFGDGGGFGVCLSVAAGPVMGSMALGEVGGAEG